VAYLVGRSERFVELTTCKSTRSLAAAARFAASVACRFASRRLTLARVGGRRL
jgi:hypothetical protein